MSPALDNEDTASMHTCTVTFNIGCWISLRSVDDFKVGVAVPWLINSAFHNDEARMV